MAVIQTPFTSFTPDLPALNNPGFNRIHNATAGRGSTQGGVTLYPLKRAALFSSTSMESRPRGCAIGSDRDGNSRVYGGSAAALYKLSPATREWTDISRSGGYTTGGSERWKFLEFGNLQIATNFHNEPQYIDMNADLQFGNLTSLVRGRHIATTKGFVVLGNCYDQLDGNVPNRVRWSGIEAPGSWAYSQATMADFQDIQNFGAITGLVTDENCYVLLQRGIVQMTFVGAPFVFQFQDRVVGTGCSVPESVITVESRHFFLSENGFQMMIGGQITPIGNGRIDRWFSEIADLDQAHLMTTVADPKLSLIMWQFVSKNSTTGKPDMVLCYNYTSGEFTTADATTHLICNAVSLPTTIDQLDEYGSIDQIPAPLDSMVWSGNQPLLFGMDENGAVYSFDGPTLDLIVETPEYQLSRMVSDKGEDVARVDACRPLFEGDGVARVQVGSRNLPNTGLSWSPLSEAHPATGFCYLRSQSRISRFRVTIAGEWRRAFSLEIDAKAVGRR
ncbi:hypothetical protein [Neorhizobium sp. NCHU2750]|uniref:hypothetical protein n=1 Tax=Neorhizobium sp. NCHU2750 TaxID=1825976 RepID=UPI000E71F4B6|nr:hypothetical protein NCHU2750_23540 [Neorhizobium sp. NCHU2750]